MGYKEKYNKLVEAIKVLQETNPSNEGIQNWVNDNVPELAESEGERIRRVIRGWIYTRPASFFDNGISKEKILAWLERQGEHLENFDEAEKEKSDFVGDGFIKCYADFQDFKEGETYWFEYIGDDKYNVRSDNLLGKTYHITPCQLYTIFKKQTWLEKQGNKIVDCPQNHQDVKHSNGEIVMEDFTGGEGFYKLQLDYLSKKQIEEVEEMVRTWNKESKTSNENIKNCIGMCLTDVNEQRFKDYGTTLKDCLDWLNNQSDQKVMDSSQNKE